MGKDNNRTLTFWNTRVGRLFSRIFNYGGRQPTGYFPGYTHSDNDSINAELDPLVNRHKPERIDVLCRKTKFTSKELQIIYRGFKNECPTGVVNEETFKLIYMQFFPHGDCSLYAHYVFKTFDQDGRGMISFEDFVMGLSMLVRGTLDEKLNWTFSLYDLDGDGVITKNELTDIVTAIYDMLGKYTEPAFDTHSAREHAERIFCKMDQDRDGVISIEEFIKTCKQDENINKSMFVFDTVL